ncbi:MAG: hypothetical protein ABIG44_12205 [Planctomycetota bacterium]
MSLDLSQFKQTRIYEQQTAIPEILEDLGRVRAIDREHEKIERQWGYIALMAIFVAVIGVVVAIITQQLGFVGITAAGIIGAIVCFIVKGRYGRFNFEDRRYELLEQALDMLGRDMAQGATCNVQLDLGPANENSKFTGKGQVRDWKVKYYTDPWLSLRGRLLDGTAFQLVLIDKLQQRSKWKRSRSGKQKHKSKKKLAHAAVLQLRIKPSRYPNLQAISADAAGAIQLPDGVEIKSLNCADARIKLKAKWPAERTMGPTPGSERRKLLLDEAQLVAMMFISLFQVLNLAKAIGKAQRSGGDQ